MLDLKKPEGHATLLKLMERADVLIWNVKDYFAIRSEGLLQKTTAEWLAILDQSDVPAMPYHTLDSLIEDPHLAEVGFF